LRATQVVAARTGLRGTITDPHAFLTEVLRLAESRGGAPAHNPLTGDSALAYPEPVEVRR